MPGMSGKHLDRAFENHFRRRLGMPSRQPGELNKSVIGVLGGRVILPK
jgi:hypothetical protein